MSNTESEIYSTENEQEVLNFDKYRKIFGGLIESEESSTYSSYQNENFIFVKFILSNLSKISSSKIDNWLDKLRYNLLMQNYDFDRFNEEFYEIIGHFTLRSEEQHIRDFLLMNNNLLPFVKQIPHQIARYFSESEMILEITKDPEELKEQELFIYIRTSLDPIEADKKLEELDNDWFLDISELYGGKLWLNLELE